MSNDTLCYHDSFEYYIVARCSLTGGIDQAYLGAFTTIDKAKTFIRENQVPNFITYSTQKFYTSKIETEDSWIGFDEGENLMNEPKLLKLADGSTIRFGNGRHPDEPIDLPCTPSEIFAEFGLTETDPGVKDVLDAFNKLLENRKNNEK